MTKASDARRCLWLAAAFLACASGPPPPPELCLRVEASSNLNLFDEEPHVVVVRLYPLQNAVAFQSVDATDLLGGTKAPGGTGDSFEITVLPGETREIRETLPRDTMYVGLLADFFHGPSRAAVEAGCPRLGKPTAVLSASDLQVR